MSALEIMKPFLEKEVSLDVLKGRNYFLFKDNNLHKINNLKYKFYELDCFDDIDTDIDDELLECLEDDNISSSYLKWVADPNRKDTAYIISVKLENEENITNVGTIKDIAIYA